MLNNLHVQSATNAGRASGGMLNMRAILFSQLLFRTRAVHLQNSLS